jgi:hypothetical protein
MLVTTEEHKIIKNILNMTFCIEKYDAVFDYSSQIPSIEVRVTQKCKCPTCSTGHTETIYSETIYLDRDENLEETLNKVLDEVSNFC